MTGASPIPLPRTDPASVGIDARAVLDFLDAAEDAYHNGSDGEIEPGHRGELHALMILRHGQVAVEGWWGPYEPQRIRLLYSLSKTFTSAAVGLAVSEGHFGYDDRIVDLLPDLAPRAGEKARTIRVRDLLAMASGHGSDAIEWVSLPLRPASIADFLAREPEGEPGVDFFYNQMCTYTLSVLVGRTTGQELHDYLRSRLFDPLGIAEVWWTQDAEGHDLGYSGLHVTTESIAAFFNLLGADGRLADQQLLPSEWIENHRIAQVQNAPASDADPNSDWQQGYGWHCWIARHGYRGDGAFGQYAIMWPDKDMLIVINSAVDDMQIMINLLETRLLPGIDRDPDPGAQAELDRRLASLWLLPVEGEARPGEAWTGRDARGGTIVLAPLPAKAGDDTDDAAWTLTWIGGDGVINTIPVGFGEWAISQMVFAAGRQQVAASGAWQDADRFLVRVQCLNSPHRFGLLLGEGGAGLSWFQPPLWSAWPSDLVIS